jgi:hypothetical protein
MKERFLFMTQFLIGFGALGLAFVPCILIFLAGGADKKHRIVGAIVCFCIWLIASGAVYFKAETNAKAWNDGYCDCGTHWELVAVSKSHGTGSTIKYYFCPNCYAEITQ